MTFELVDLRDYPMPFFDEPKSPMRERPKNEVAQKWARKVGELDGLAFIRGSTTAASPRSRRTRSTTICMMSRSRGMP